MSRADTLSGPRRRMSMFFLGDALPAVAGAPDIYAAAKDLKVRGVPVRKTEEDLLTKTLWCILQVQHDQEESEQHAALALLAALVLAIIEDDDFSIPEGADTASRRQLELLAIDVMRENSQLNMSLGATIGIYDIRLEHSRDLADVQSRVPDALLTPELQGVLVKLKTHLSQGEGIFEQHSDPERRVRHKLRLDKAYSRSTNLLARLLTKGEGADHAVVRGHIIRREHRHIEIDALGAERVSEAEQIKKTRQLLTWTEEDMGEELTDENKAALAARIREIATEEHSAEQPSGDGDPSSSWFFDMD